jgi:hypothetical protein
MDFWKTMGVLLRRWYVSVPIFVLCAVLGGGVFVAVPTQYESTGTIVLTAPVSGGFVATDPANSQGPGNPLLDFAGSLTITGQLLVQSLSSATVQNEIAEQGGVSTYQAGDGGTGGPFVVVIADAKSRQQAERTVTLALNHAATELNQRQKAAQAPPSTYIGTQVVVAATPATTKISGKVKAGGVALAGGIVVSLAAAFAADSVLANRRRRRRGDRGRAAVDRGPVDLTDDESTEDERAVTQQMRPAPPPRSLPQPVRSGAGPRPVPRPQSGTTANGRRELGPMHKPHPAKPRVHPVPVPGKLSNNGTKPSTNNGSTNNGSTNNGSTNNGSTNNGSTNNGPANGRPVEGGQHGQGNHDWPRTEFRSPDSSAG